MSPATKKHQQLILLEPARAALLEELSAETRIPKQVLLREAVDFLLAKYAKLGLDESENLYKALKQSQRIAEHFASEEGTWGRRCKAVLPQIQQAFKEFFRLLNH